MNIMSKESKLLRAIDTVRQHIVLGHSGKNEDRFDRSIAELLSAAEEMRVAREVARLDRQAVDVAKSYVKELKIIEETGLKWSGVR